MLLSHMSPVQYSPPPAANSSQNRKLKQPSTPTHTFKQRTLHSWQCSNCRLKSGEQFFFLPIGKHFLWSLPIRDANTNKIRSMLGFWIGPNGLALRTPKLGPLGMRASCTLLEVTFLPSKDGINKCQYWTDRMIKNKAFLGFPESLGLGW